MVISELKSSYQTSESVKSFWELKNKIYDLFEEYSRNNNIFNKKSYIDGVNNIQEVVSLYSDIKNNPGKYYEEITYDLGKGDYKKGKKKLLRIAKKPSFIPKSVIIPFLPEEVIGELEKTITNEVLIDFCKKIRDNIGINSMKEYFQNKELKNYELLREWSYGERRTKIPVVGEVVDYFDKNINNSKKEGREYSYLYGLKQVIDLLNEAYKNPRTKKWIPVINVLTQKILPKVENKIEDYLY